LSTLSTPLSLSFSLFCPFSKFIAKRTRKKEKESKIDSPKGEERVVCAIDRGIETNAGGTYRALSNWASDTIVVCGGEED
jgi:hypothetical protein